MRGGRCFRKGAPLRRFPRLTHPSPFFVISRRPTNRSFPLRTEAHKKTSAQPTLTTQTQKNSSSSAMAVPVQAGAVADRPDVSDLSAPALAGRLHSDPLAGLCTPFRRPSPEEPDSLSADMKLYAEFFSCTKQHSTIRPFFQPGFLLFSPETDRTPHPGAGCGVFALSEITRRWRRSCR